MEKEAARVDSINLAMDQAGNVWRDSLADGDESYGFARRFLLRGVSQQTGFAEIKIDMTNPERKEAMRDAVIESQIKRFVAEDRKLIKLIRENLPVDQIIEVPCDELNVSHINNARAMITTKNIPAAHCFGHLQLWNCILSSELCTFVEASAKYEDILLGKLGSIIGLDLHSDAFHHPKHKITEKGEIFFFGHPEFVGKIEVNNEGEAVLKNADEKEVVWDVPYFADLELFSYRAISMIRLV